MSHFKSRLTSPHVSIGFAYIYVIIIGLILYASGCYQHNSFFAWGAPFTFFNVKIESQSTFYVILAMIFFHQVINGLVNTTLYPWLINSIQDPKNTEMEYSRVVSLLLINAFDFYSELDLVLILAGFTSQISFVIAVVFANTIVSTLINDRYIRAKQREPLLPVHSRVSMGSYS